MEHKYGIRTCPKMLMLWKRYRSLDFEYAQDNGLNVIRSCLNFFIYHRWRIEGAVFFKIIHNLVYFPTTIILPLCHHFPLGIIMIISYASLLHALITSSTHFYLTPFPLWNNLPSQAVTCTTLSLFKYYTLPLFS